MITWLIIIILMLSFPLGYLLAYLCKDELTQLRRWFKLIIIVCLIGIFIFLLLIQNFTIVFILIFIALVCLVSLRMSYNKKFLGRENNKSKNKKQKKLITSSKLDNI